MHQVTIYATLTDATPQAVADLIADPRTDTITPPPAPAPEQDRFGHSGKNTPGHAKVPTPAFSRTDGWFTCPALPVRGLA
jgi:hypothetical protein